MLSPLPFASPGHVIEKATAATPTPTAVAGAGGRLALESARRATEAGLIEPCLVGDPEAITAAASGIGWDLAPYRCVSAKDETKAAEAAVALARGSEVAALMKGQIHTDTLMRAVVDRENGLRAGRRMSHIFYMTAPDRQGALTITDAAVNVAPDAAVKLDIINNAVDLLHALGTPEPKIAVLSATDTPIAAMPSSLEAAEVVRRAVQGAVTGAVVDGPFALDLAISPEAATVKGVDSPVAGQADILLVPNIETGNALYKAMVYFMSATAAGLVMGAKVPIILTSRADPPEARLTAAALAAIVARHCAEDS
ncbi:MAG: bifunctional enoyl-CoA hydratase/phosphate acetyltransferase [Kiloniellales bacterium]